MHAVVFDITNPTHSDFVFFTVNFLNRIFLGLKKRIYFANLRSNPKFGS